MSTQTCLVVLVLIALMVVRDPALGSGPNVTIALNERAVTLRHGGKSLAVSLSCPRLVIGDETVGGAAPDALTGSAAAGKRIEAPYAPVILKGGGKLEVRLVAEWSPKERVLRKWARLRLTSGPPVLLKEVVLEEIESAGSQLGFEPGAIQSYPAFLAGFFAGVEFPVASTRLEQSRLLLAHRPGVRLQPGVWYESRRAVYGVAEPGKERAAFQSYVAAHRPKPRGLHANYNSWWTSPVPYAESDILKLMETFEEKLHRAHGVAFDTFCIDMGWSNPKSLWEIDSKLFPDGFAKIRQAAARMGCRLGLWISPSSCYPGALDNSWAAGEGYETFAHGGGQRYACLAGERYRSALTKRLVEMVTRWGVRHIKFDGYAGNCPSSNHGHEPGELSAESIAQGIIEVFSAVRKAAPDVWMETTCMGWNPSPWWLFHVNSVIGTYGDDAPYGRVPAPVYRESYTTARDYFNLQGAHWLPIPIEAQEVLGVVHQTAEPFTNDAVVTVLRGHMFLPLYINPAYMTDSRWRALADLLKWSRAHSAMLAETIPLLPQSWKAPGPNPKSQIPNPKSFPPRFRDDAVMPREPYGYAHWNGGRGLVCLRNPWVTPQVYSLKVGSAAKGMLAAVSIYPEPRRYGSSLRGGRVLEVPLAPYETLVLSIEPHRPGEALPRVAGPPTSAGWIKLDIPGKHVTRVEFEGEGAACGPDWTSPIGDLKSAVEVKLEGKVMLDAPQGELLILLEGKQPPSAPVCKLTINGREPEITSTGSETGWGAAGLPKREHWLFLRSPLAAGENTLSLDLLADPSVTLSVWVWATKPGTTQSPKGDFVPSLPQFQLPEPELISLDSAPLLEPTDLSAVTGTLERKPRPIERIDGVFLDSIEPVSATQGWGTLQRNRSVWEKPMTIGGRRFARGLGTHAPSRIVYDLGGKYRRFQAWAGADEATAPTITFCVIVDGKTVWESGLMTRSDPARRVDIDMSAAKTLELIVGDGGNGIVADHADWADARLLR